MYRKYSFRQIQKHIKNQQGSGLSISKYCKVNAISFSTFQKWKANFTLPEEHPPAFYSIPITEPKPAFHSIEVKISSHIIVSFPLDTPKAELSEFIRGFL